MKNKKSQLMLGPAFRSKVTTPATPISPHVGLPLANQKARNATSDDKGEPTGKAKYPERGGGHMISTDDLEYPREYRTLGNSARRFSNVGLVHTSEHRHTVIAAQSLEALTNLHKADMERKRDAFMDHLKNKYPPQHSLPPSPSPSHGSMRGTSERNAREQQQPNYWSFKHLKNPWHKTLGKNHQEATTSRSPRHSQSTQSGLADQASKLSFASAESLETMSEADMPLGFNRMNRFRQSLPLSRSASQNKLRSPGVLFLQFGDETRRVHITHELNSLETLHALIVHMFPQKLTAGMLKSPNTAILIKDEARNVFYELEDVRDIQDRSIIKIYRKEPIYASYPAAHLANGDLRREMVYTSRDSSPTRRLNTLPSSTASPSSGSPSRSRLSYSGGRPPSFAGPGHPHPQGSQHPSHSHHPSPSHGQAQGLTASSSAILERRDVKPDEEMSGKNMVLLKNEGLYADPYSLMHEGRLSIASTQSLATIADPFGFPVSGGLYRRGSVRSLSTYSAAALQSDLEDSLYKPGGSLYSDTYGSSTLGMGFRLPPSSPQKIPDVQLRDRDSFTGSPSRGSPVRTTFRKDSASSSVFVESPKSRPSSSSEPLGDGSKGPGFGSQLSGGETDARRDRMEAMEKQIASLTGLVQSVLTRAPDSDSTEKTESTSDGSATGTLTPSAPLALMPPPSSGGSQASTVSRLQMQLHLHDLQQNATDLRKQLSQLRKMQLQNQDSIRSLLKRTETELSLRLSDALRKQEDPLQRQRLLVEEERLKYLNEEELIIQQLHDLEKSVEEIQKEMSVSHRHVTVQELEEKSSLLRKLGETLTELKNQFPGLQSKMRVVLRVEVEAVKFLKEEPHRLDALLKRCKSITETLTTLRRQVNEGVWKAQDEYSSPSPKLGGGDDYRKNSDFEIPTSPPLNLNETSLANWSPHSGQCHAHSNPSHAHREKDSHGLVGSLKGRGLEELGGRGGSDKASSVEVRLAAERDWEEKRASLTQYSAQDINRLLEETQAELMKAIPDLDFAAKQIKPAQNQNQNQNQNQSQSPSSTNATPEHRPNKPQHKLSSKDGGSRRGSDELTVARYRTEKPSKSPPPPPPRRSFPSSPGLTTRSGEMIIPGKIMKKSESEESESLKPHVKLRRSISEAPRSASTPPTIAGGEREEGDDDKLAAELEQPTASQSGLHEHSSDFTEKPLMQHEMTSSPVPQIVLTECNSLPTSPSEDSAQTRPSDSAQTKKDNNTGNDIRVSYFSHIVRTPRLSLWKQDLTTSQKVPRIQDLDAAQRELQSPVQDVTQSCPPLTRERAIKQPLKREPRVQESLEAATEPKDERKRKSDTTLSVLQQNGPVETSQVGLIRTQGVGGEKEDICHSTYRRLDSLEDTIRELELSLMEFSTDPHTGDFLPTSAQTQSSSIQRSGSPRHTEQNHRDGGETNKPIVPPKPSCISSSTAKTGGARALSRLKHLQQSGSEKVKTSKQRDEFLKNQGQQQALSLNISRARATESLLASTRAASFSGHLPSRLRKYPQEVALSSLTASSNQAKALLAGLSASSLSAEALLLSSTFRHHRLLREKNFDSSSLPLPISNGRSPLSPTSPTSSSSPSSPSTLTSLSLSSLALKPSAIHSLEFDRERNKTEPKTVTRDDME
ncbi:SRC kinase signaling inhibitor 1 isoform X14 [Rhinichthys klamathensis goyatoka]|uniref:SRC kinase signaling inhibitor 1 isoform X14 n=1 Tax=Rhinichthys klamathensis goyatoka TaxID=3034132 RepID=UPI0024B5DFD3|nr:SRC kinase signaling inhibitor 1 isoform X14 [Rhinichthys klamathensis goyatoka]